MKWVGTWRNQYGSTLRVTDDEGYEIRGSFRTAFSDSSSSRRSGLMTPEV